MFGKQTVKKAFTTTLVMLLISVLIFTANAYGTSPNSGSKGVSVNLGSPHVPGQIALKFQEGVNENSQKQLISEAGAKEVQYVSQIKVHILHIPNEKAMLQVINNLHSHNREVKYAEPVYYRQATFAPNDSYYSQQWDLPKVKADLAWNIDQDASSVTVGIIDTGVDAQHPDLKDRLVPGWNYDSSSPDYDTDQTQDNNGHGTHVAGIAAATANNGVGVAGIAFNAKIMPVKVLSSAGSGDDSDIAQGIAWAADHGAQILNLSFGETAYSQMLEDAVNYAYDANCLVVAAAGNDNSNEFFYPAAFTNSMAVAATTTDDTKASFSNYGSYISVAAPGTNIFSTYWTSNGSTYTSLSGTSMSAPLVCGIAALSLAQDNTRTNSDLRYIIEHNTDDVMTPGWDEYSGYGRVDAYNVVTGSISGTVTLHATGKAVANALVKVSQNGTVILTTSTDSNGYYHIVHLKQGTYDVSVSASGYPTVSKTGINVKPGYETPNTNFAL